MMKKNGFTLAEVLITLAIIGVVATLTLPALMTNTQEQQARTALKKGINTLTEAAQMSSAIAGFDYGSLRTDSTSDQESQSLFGLLANRASVDFQLTGVNTAAANLVNTGVANTAGNNFVVFFRDGSALSYPTTGMTTANTTAMDTKGTNDGLPQGYSVIYDTNGQKGPNLFSNCAGEAGWSANDAAEKDDSKNVCTKENRVIRDQFGVRLRGGYAVPNGAAARWAFDN